MRLTLRRPDDWHLHLRDGALLQAVAPHSAAHFGRALVMPNLSPPITTAQAARDYAARIVAAAGGRLQPLMTCYLTDQVDGDALVRGYTEGAWIAAKLYPANATTNSSHGVTDLGAIRPALERMAEAGMPLCVHGEVTDPQVDVFDREARFLHDVLGPLISAIPALKVVVEHATTRQAVSFVRGQSTGVAATITPHHLWWNRNALFEGGLRPHAYCLPILKREEDRAALIGAATSGDPRFFAGTDSAPHLRHSKECDHGCAGVFNAPTALSAYAEVFEAAESLDHLEGFLSVHGAAFYGLAPSSDTLTLVREPWEPAPAVPVQQEGIAVFLGNERLAWKAEP